MTRDEEGVLFGFIFGVMVGVGGCYRLSRNASVDRCGCKLASERDQQVELDQLRSDLQFMSERLRAVSTLVMMHPYHAPSTSRA